MRGGGRGAGASDAHKKSRSELLKQEPQKMRILMHPIHEPTHASVRIFFFGTFCFKQKHHESIKLKLQCTAICPVGHVTAIGRSSFIIIIVVVITFYIYIFCTSQQLACLFKPHRFHSCEFCVFSSFFFLFCASFLTCICPPISPLPPSLLPRIQLASTQ